MKEYGTFGGMILRVNFEEAKLTTQISTRENRTDTLKRSTLLGLKSIPTGQLKWVSCYL